jgi:type I restriction enzyme S subunit
VFTGKKDVNQTVEDGKYPFFSCSAQDFRSNDYIYEGKAILVAGNGNTGKSKFYDGKFDLYQRTYAIVCESDLIYYLFMRFKTDFEVIYAGGSRGTAIPYIVMKNITKYKFLYNKELIDKFVSIIKPIFSQINTLQLQSANLTRQRDLLLPRLMSGQLTPLTNQ